MQKQYLTKDDDRMTVRVDSVIESYEPQRSAPAKPQASAPIDT